MDVLTTLGRTLGFSFSAGINLYATVAILGLASRYGWVNLPPQFKVFDHDVVIIGAALIMRDRVHRGQGAVGRLALGRGPHRDPAAWRRAHRGYDFRRDVGPGHGTHRAARRHGGGKHARDQSRHARGRQHQP